MAISVFDLFKVGICGLGGAGANRRSDYRIALD